MLVNFVSDVHGNFEPLRELSRQDETLVILGDLLNYVDYHNPANGVLGTIFGAEKVRRFRDFRTSGKFVELHEYDRQLWSTLQDPEGAIAEVVSTYYREVISLLNGPTLVILGNVDMKTIWSEIAPNHLRCLDGETVSVDGRLFGFVAGGCVKYLPAHSPWKSHDRSRSEYQSVVNSLGPVDVLCSHLPPKIGELRYDLVAQRHEMYGFGLLEYIETHRPALSIFGHIHQPQSSRVLHGSTSCINAGHFQQTSKPLTLNTDDIGSEILK